MTQLDIFDVIEKKEVAPETALQPTFEIEYFCIDRAQRLTWIRAKNEDAARYQFTKKTAYIAIISVKKSDRTLEEIEAL